MNGWTVFLLALAIVLGLPGIAYIAVLMWPERIPEDKSVHAIAARIHAEADAEDPHDEPYPPDTQEWQP
ncbi:hypothetical protein [Nocardia gamkensis]|uniref:Uncharacterized protein n=1 Tax=Nocardia gamkensis TaxID=352869 RepID=A0A7X6L5Y3_9NOCA|nr:hypothetical protein [Nocardia gamkensis]NKY28453.1 hypothetical protein [Nocardia gamkensis]NQE69164.1 hypothetical protein [Nocardia gamkensis]